jgi:hypothetical protein
MTNEMMRPCTLWGHTFDAMRVKIVEINMAISSEPFQVWVEVWEENPDGAIPITHKKCFSEHEIIIANREAITTIADALNAPVLAKDEVLKDLPKDARIWKVWDDGLELCFIRWFNKRWAYNVVDAHSTMTGGGCDVAFKEKELCSADRIKPDDPKTAEYLRQFTLDGVRIKEGG